MKTLLIMRHAKSSWGDASLSDFDRPLNARGRQAANQMARYLLGSDLVPDHVALSSAQRVQETWAGLAEGLGASAPESIETHAQLYLAGADQLLETIRGFPSEVSRGLIIAHQPGLSTLVETLTASIAPDACRGSFSHFPTAAIAVLKFERTHWNELHAGAAQYQHFVAPKTLSLD